MIKPRVPDNLDAVTYPKAAGYCVIYGRFVYGNADGLDTDELPDASAVQGTMEITADRDVVTYRGDPPTTFFMRPIQCKLSGSGFLSPAGKPYLVVIPTQGGGISEQDWTYTAVFRNKAGDLLHEVSFAAPHGGQVDLTLVLDTRSSAGAGVDPLAAMVSHVAVSVYAAESAARKAESAAVAARADADAGRADAGKATVAATGAAASAKEAAVSAQTATEKANKAANSAASADTRAATAETKATEAAASAASADTRAATAETKANEATEAAKSADGRAATAETKANEATEAAKSADGRAATAETKATEAAASAASADGRATTAETKATEAAASAARADTRATTAETKANEAAASAASADGRATAAEKAATTAAADTTATRQLIANTPIEFKWETIPNTTPPQVKGSWRRTGETEWKTIGTINSGVDGISVTAAKIDPQGNLILSMSRGNPINAGPVIGPPPILEAGEITASTDGSYTIEIPQTSTGKYAINLKIPTPAAVTEQLLQATVTKAVNDATLTLDTRLNEIKLLAMAGL